MANLRNPSFQVLWMVKENINYLKWPLEYFLVCVDIIVWSENNAGVACYAKEAVFSCTHYSL